MPSHDLKSQTDGPMWGLETGSQPLH